jgi:DNA modification methylase
VKLLPAHSMTSLDVVHCGDALAVLRADGTLWLNLGDSYATTGSGTSGYDDGRANRDARLFAGVPAGFKRKDLLGIPWRMALALLADGWWLRSDIIWHKPNCMPESVTDRPTKAHEYVFLLTKAERYYYDAEAIRAESAPSSQARARYNGGSPSPKNLQAVEEGVVCGPLSTKKAYGQGRNRRTVWTIATQPSPIKHFALMPPKLAEMCILAGAPPGGVVLDPFGGAGTTGIVAQGLGRRYVLIELNPEYAQTARQRIHYRGNDRRMLDEQAAGVQQMALSHEGVS